MIHEPLAAATVMVARPSTGRCELFMLRRSSRSAFMPDVFVFPGGRVEPPDGSPDARERLAGAPDNIDWIYLVAAARETFEECGLLFATEPIAARQLAEHRARLLAGSHAFTQMLTDLHTRVDGNALQHFSHWITPPRESRRFDTHFFVAQAPADQAAQADAFETHDGIWIAPRDALARYAAGTFALSFPTIKHLERVSAFDTPESLLAYAKQKPIRTVMPIMQAGHDPAIPTAIEDIW